MGQALSNWFQTAHHAINDQLGGLDLPATTATSSGPSSARTVTIWHVGRGRPSKPERCNGAGPRWFTIELCAVGFVAELSQMNIYENDRA
ncbi:hypothetical protein GCM10018965_008230 [Nonomuraea roseola]